MQINNDRSLLPNVTLKLQWNDTRGDTVLATRAITEMICDGVKTFFGPEGPCHTEAIVSQSRNIPMISYVWTTNNFFMLCNDKCHLFSTINVLLFIEMFRLYGVVDSHICTHRTSRYSGMRSHNRYSKKCL